MGAAAVVRAVYEEYGFTWEPGGYHRDLERLEEHYLARGWPFFVVELDGQLVGTAGLELFDEVPGAAGEVVVHQGVRRVAGTDCALERLYVLRSQRGRGVGRALFAATLDAARGLSRRRLEIWSDKRFAEAHRLYEAHGARQAGERICHDPDQSPEWGFSLAL